MSIKLHDMSGDFSEWDVIRPDHRDDVVCAYVKMMLGEPDATATVINRTAIKATVRLTY